MSCVLTTALSKPCGDGVSGIKKMWAVEHTALDSITETSGVITAMSLNAGKEFFGWYMEPGAGSMTAPIQRSRENGTLFYEHTVACKFNRWETTKRNEIKIISAADLLIICLDRNGKYWLMGKENGMSLESGSGAIGANMGDFSGFEMSFKSSEIDLPVEINSATVTSLDLA